jgi:hypothetical protein
MEAEQATDLLSIFMQAVGVGNDHLGDRTPSYVKIKSVKYSFPYIDLQINNKNNLVYGYHQDQGSFVSS